MKQIKWLLDLANTKPLLFSVALLMIAISAMYKVVLNRERKLDDCAFENTTQRLYYQRKLDSVSNASNLRDIEYNKKIADQFQMVIANYQEQIDALKQVSDKVKKTITKNKNLIQQNNDQIENLKQ